ncbi:MAG: hypothetical protein ACREQO_06950 [Candidatus Binatia bacterium]
MVQLTAKKAGRATPSNSANILTAWIVRHEENFPRLTTCYIL